MNLSWGIVAGVAGGLVLWAAFICLALISRRYEKVFRVATPWRAMAAAPSGLLIYVMLVVSGLASDESEIIKNFSYCLLGVSGLACAWATRKFAVFLSLLDQKRDI